MASGSNLCSAPDGPLFCSNEAVVGSLCNKHLVQSTGYDPVNPPDPAVAHPAHYNNGAIECIDAIAEAVRGLPAMDAVCIGNAIKYLWRHDMKGGIQDLEKAKWYIDRTIAERAKRGAK